jgi:hypothetical protein
LSGCNQLVENVLRYVDLDDRIPTAHIARGQGSEKPRHLCIVRGISTRAKLDRPLKLQSHQLRNVKTIVENIQGAIDVSAMIEKHQAVL